MSSVLLKFRYRVYGNPTDFLLVNFGQRNGKVYVQGRGLDLEISQEKGELASHNNALEEFIIGIRPEDVSVDEFGVVICIRTKVHRAPLKRYHNFLSHNYKRGKQKIYGESC